MKKRILAMALAVALVMGSVTLAAGMEKTITVTPMSMTINGQTVTPVKSDGTAAEVFAYEGATYVPLRYLSELLGVEVEWDRNEPNTAKLVNVPGISTGASMEADVIVVGGGLSGLTSAVFAAQRGASVIVIEKLGLLGGSGLLSSGSMMTCNSGGLIDGEDSVESVLEFWKSTSALKESSGYPDMDRLTYTLGKTGKTVCSLVDMGLPVASTTPNTAGTGSMVAVEGRGAGLMAFLKSEAEELGVSIHLNCKGEELLLENGKVVGVKASGNKGTQEFRGKSVILATGGFSRGAELVEQWVPNGNVVYDGRGCVGNTGDGMLMALEAGAVLYENPTLMMSYFQVNSDYERNAKVSSVLGIGGYGVLGGALGVSPTGERFQNEAHTAYSAFGFSMVDRGYDHCYMLLNATDETRAILEQGVELGEVTKGTLSEIGAQLNMNAETLKNTFDKYNAACENGVDKEFGKVNTRLVKLDERVLYAVKVYPTSIGTLGGVKTNYECQVLRSDSSVIEGLFAVGEMSNRPFYNYHYIGGASLGLYSTMGRIAGELAAQRAGK